jgi:4-amino-4-deoxy-L-arabinose transferase-like glycosyltransferase
LADLMSRRQLISPPPQAYRLRSALARRPDCIALLTVASVALLVRLAFNHRAMALGTKDSYEYFAPAYSLLNGAGFDLALRRPPIYPLFAATVMQLFGQNLAAIVFVQHLLGVVTVALTYWLGRLAFGRAAGLTAALLAAVSSVMLIHEHYILSESLFTLLLTAACLSLVIAMRRDTSGWYLAAGLALGLAVLARPVAQVVLLVVPLGLLAHRGSLARALRPTLLVLLGAALLVVPWTIRNKLVYGELSASGSGRFLSARVVKHDRGYTFFEPATADQYGPRGARAREIFQEEADARPEEGPIYSRYRQELGLSEAESDALLREIALEGLARRPAHYLQTTSRMFLDLFAGDQKEELLRWHYRERNQERLMNQWGEMSHLLGPPTAGQQAEFEAAEALGSIFRPTRWLTPLVAGLVLAVAVGLLRPARRPAIFLAATVGIMLLASAALVGEVPRYRYPLDPLILVLAAGGYVTALAELLALARPRLRLGLGEPRTLSEPSR